MKIERATASMFGVQVDLECLTHRIGLYEVALIMDMEPVMGGMVLQIGNKSSDVDDCQQ